MKRTLIAIMLIIFLSSYVKASIEEPDGFVKGYLINYGTVEMTEQQQKYEVPDQPGRYVINTTVKFIEKTDEIPLKRGTAFGIAWAISGLMEDNIEVIYMIEYPEMTLENGKKSTVFKGILNQPVWKGIAGSVDGYVLNHDYELVPGDWVVSIQYKDIKISKKFTVK